MVSGNVQLFTIAMTGTTNIEEYPKNMKIKAELLKSFQPLYPVSKLLSINPYRDEDGEFVALTQGKKIYGYVVLFFVVFIMVLSFVFQIFYTYASLAISMIVLDVTSSVTRTILVMLSVWFAITRHGQQMRSFFKKLEKADRALSFLVNNYELFRNKLSVKCVTITVITVVFAIVETFFWSNVYDPLWGMLGTCIVKYWMIYYKLVVFLHIHSKIDVLKQRFKYVNEILNRSVKNAGDDENGATCSNILVHQIFKSQTIKKPELHMTFETHNLLCDLVNIVNDVHGFQILVIICAIILTILSLLNTGIHFFLSHSDSDQKNSIKFEYGAVGIQGVLCLGFMIMSMILAAQCSTTVEEANETRTVAQKLLLLEPMVTTETSRDRIMYREELILFINTSRRPTFSAGGFFTVDYTLLLAIMGAVTSYFIVLLQFANVG